MREVRGFRGRERDHLHTLEVISILQPSKLSISSNSWHCLYLRNFDEWEEFKGGGGKLTLSMATQRKAMSL
jgi:hypothetical protein